MKRKNDLLNVGALAAGLFSSMCCLGPAIFAGLGIGAGVTGFLAGVAGFVKILIPYRPFFIVLAVGFIALAFWKVYRGCPVACETNDEEARKRLTPQKIGLWIVSAVTVILMLSPYWL